MTRSFLKPTKFLPIFNTKGEVEYFNWNYFVERKWQDSVYTDQTVAFLKSVSIV